MIKSNFVQRTIYGSIYVVLILGAIFSNSPYLTGALLAAMGSLGIFEFQSIVSINRDRLFLKIWHSLMGLLLFFIVTTSGVEPLDQKEKIIFSLPYTAYVFFYILAELFRNRKSPIREVAYAFAAHAYCIIPLAVVHRLCVDSTLILPENIPAWMSHTFWLLPMFVFIWINDTGAFLVGSLIGKTKLFERISPKKTWEGFMGGVLFTLLFSIGFYFLFPEVLSFLQWLLLALLVSILATLGDLFESLLKRTYNVKDSGSIMPGHGGILDRIDSLIMVSVPVFIFVCIVSML